MSQSTGYAIAKLKARMDAEESFSVREDVLQCKPGNKPCGKICIPQAEKCALTGEKAEKKGGLTGAGKVAAFGAAAIAGGAIGYTALKAGQKASEARRQKQMEEEKDKPKENSEPTKSANPPSEAPQARQSAPRSPKKQKGVKPNSSPTKSANLPSEEPKQLAAGTRPNANNFFSKLNPFKKKEGVPSGGSAQQGKNRLIANKQNALDKESRRKKIFNNVDNSVAARSARKVANADSLSARFNVFLVNR